jgi:glycosyltransferase involved in cell wall biosynthesis
MSNLDLVEKNETNKDSRGGTELLQHRLYDGTVPRDLLEKFQIVFSRVRELDPDRKHIFYAHDLPEDPESSRLSDPIFRKKFERFVFVSNWQMEQYYEKRGVKYQESSVIKNSIIPIDIGDKLKTERKSDKIRLVYHSTPHRGLEILVPVFVELAKQNPDIVLDVYSSFKLYGWDQRDEQYKAVFDICKEHPQINYHGTVSNDELRAALVNADIFAYPSIWKETSCLCLIESMSAGVLCVHPNLAALPETSMGLTWMYQWQEDANRHANAFYQVLQQGINVIRTQYSDICSDLRLQKIQIDRVHNWNAKAAEWTALLQSLEDK